MARIAIDARMLYATGIGRYTLRLLEQLQAIKTDHEFIVVIQPRDRGRFKPTKPNFSVVEVEAPIYTFAEQTTLARKLGELHADLVHFPSPNLPLTYGCKYVTTVHDLTLLNYVNRRDESGLKALYKYEVKPAVFRLVLSRGVRGAAHVITPTEYVRDEVARVLRVDENKITATHEAAEPLGANPKAVKPLAGQEFLFYLGNAYPYKNLRRLIDAFRSLKPGGTKLVLAGGSDFFYQDLKAYAGNGDDVVFLESPTDAELVWLYQNAKLFVFPSFSEGFGLPGLEAMQYGLPVAAARASCLPEVYGEAAVYFDPNDTDDMASVIGETLADTKKLAEMKKLGTARAEEFSWKRMAEQTLAVYERALKE